LAFVSVACVVRLVVVDLILLDFGCMMVCEGDSTCIIAHLANRKSIHTKYKRPNEEVIQVNDTN